MTVGLLSDGKYTEVLMKLNINGIMDITYSYGGITFGAPQYNNEHTYNAERYNLKLDVQYLRARYYSPSMASFLTKVRARSVLGAALNIVMQWFKERQLSKAQAVSQSIKGNFESVKGKLTGKLDGR